MRERIDHQGWLAGVRRVPSPNHDARPASAPPALIVIHGISLPPGHFGRGPVDALFCNRLDGAAHPFYAGIAGLRVSAHALIERTGALTQYVSFAARAWHAGRSSWAGRSRVNDFSVGIELEGTDECPYTPAQYRQLAALIAALRGRYPVLGRQAPVGHSDIAPGRKTDPGPAFDQAMLDHCLERACT